MLSFSCFDFASILANQLVNITNCQHRHFDYYNKVHLNEQITLKPIASVVFEVG
jgi:hypothetical protein